jgi:hypothetical protein
MRSVVVFGKGTQAGWSPIALFSDLASRCFDAELQLDPVPGNHLKGLLMLAGRRRSQSAGELCLVVAASSHALGDILNVPGWFSRFRTVVGYVTDPYWTHDIPLVVKRNRIYDHIFLSCEEDVPEWQRQVGTRISCLPWGCDALDYGSFNSLRPWDIVRVGRQPQEWDDDEINSSVAQSLNLSYHPRPTGSSSVSDWAANQAMVMKAYSSAKFLIAFSNIVHSSEHTHPSREYITGRWTDALACGSVVAGIPPRAPSIDTLLWPEATLDLKTTRLHEGMALLREAVSSWSPDQSKINHLRSLERLDWRWRLSTIARTVGVKSGWLESELHRLQSRIALLKNSEPFPSN